MTRTPPRPTAALDAGSAEKEPSQRRITILQRPKIDAGQEDAAKQRRPLPPRPSRLRDKDQDPLAAHLHFERMVPLSWEEDNPCGTGSGGGPPDAANSCPLQGRFWDQEDEPTSSHELSRTKKRTKGSRRRY